jgi:hypothetical protein
MIPRLGSDGGRMGYAINSPSNRYSEKSTVFQGLAQEGRSAVPIPDLVEGIIRPARWVKLPDDRSLEIGAGASADDEVA